MSVTAELVGGPIDGTRFTVPEPPPYQWKRYASEPDPVSLLTTPDPSRIEPIERPTELYVRDLSPRCDGIWCYRWEGVR